MSVIDALSSGGGDNLVVAVAKAVTTGVVSNLLYGVSETLSAVAATAADVTPQCKSSLLFPVDEKCFFCLYDTQC